MKILFLHIPKTAGTAIRNAIVRNNPSLKVLPASDMPEISRFSVEELSGYDFFAGHFDWSHFDFLGPDLFAFTFLREPHERVLSHYFCLRTLPLIHGTAFTPENFPDLFDAATKSPREAFLTPDALHRYAARDNLDNLYAHLFFSRSFHGARLARRAGVPRERVLEIARSNLKRFPFVGSFRYLDEDLREVEVLTGLRFRHDLRLENVTETVPPDEQESALKALDGGEEVLQLFHDFSALDRVLYDEVCSRRADRHPPEAPGAGAVITSAATDPPLVTIVTPSYNQGRWIRKTLESVAAQTYPRIEHLVVDGGSTDETVPILKETPGIRWISEKDRGQADAINKGIRISGGDLIAYLNSDDLLYPDAVSIVVDAFRRDPSIDLLYGDGTVIDEEGNTLWEWLSRPEDFRLLADFHFLWNDFTNYILQQATFWRRSLHERVGYFDESFHYALDVEFWLRIGYSGARMVHVPKKLGLFRMVPGTKSLSSPVVFWPDYLELFRRYHGAHRIGPFVEQFLYEGMAKAGLSIDEAFADYMELLEGRWADLSEAERTTLRGAGLKARGPALVLLADDVWQRGDAPRAASLRSEAAKFGQRALLRPRSILHLLKASSGPAAPALRRLWDQGISAYKSWRYQWRYREAASGAAEDSV